MRVFVTGASGFIGSAVVHELITAGHQVLGLARSDASAQAITQAGAEVIKGDVEDLDSLRKGAQAADAVIHTAFIHDFSKFKENCEIDRRAIEAMGTVLAGTGKPLLITSGTALLSPGRLATEQDQAAADSTAIPRVATEEAARAVAAQGVNVSLMRMPPSVHGEGDQGFVPMLIALAREKGVAAYIGEGNNRWPAVHRLDAARLYVLALEKGAGNMNYHAVGDEGVSFRQIAEVIGRHLNVPVVSKSPEEAAEHFGWFAHFASLDVPASSQQTRELLGWEPTHPGLITELDSEVYFK